MKTITPLNIPQNAERKAMIDFVVFLYVTLFILISVVSAVIRWFPKYKLMALAVVVVVFVACIVYDVCTAKLGYQAWEYK